MKRILGMFASLALALGVLGGATVAATAVQVAAAPPAAAVSVTNHHTQKMRVYSIFGGHYRTEYWKWEYRNYSWWESYWSQSKVDGWYTKSYGAKGLYLDKWTYWGKTKPRGSFVYVTVAH